jgi:hypothetical protein
LPPTFRYNAEDLDHLFCRVDELSRFIRANCDPKLPLLVVGDFNTYPAVWANFLMRKKQTPAG